MDKETDTGIELAMKATSVLKVVPQPILGQLERTEEPNLVISHRTINKEALCRFIPPIISSTGDDSEDDDSEEEESLDNEFWDMEM